MVVGKMKHFQNYKGKDGTENTHFSGRSGKFVLTKANFLFKA